MGAQRYLIVNADDLGQSHGINQGIMEAHVEGIVTSASLMVRWPAVTEAADRARHHPDLSLGLHVDLGEWRYAGGSWQAVYEVVPLDDTTSVTNEIRGQLEHFRHLTGRQPTHLDSHQHVHRREPVRTILSDIAATIGVPLRHFHPGIRYCGSFYGQTEDGTPDHSAISLPALRRIFEAIPVGCTELACHPGYADDMNTMYRDERLLETRLLCDPAVRDAIADCEIQLVSFHQIDDALSC